jgi:HlyD family secretion protein
LLRKPVTYFVLIGAIGLLAVAGLAGFFSSGKGAGDAAGGAVAVKRGDLVITVTEGGNLRAKDSITITNEVEGLSTIADIVLDGTYVQKDDIILKIDSKELEDRKADQEARLHSVIAEAKASEEDLSIQKNEAQSKITLAQQTAEFAQIDLDKYIKGDWPQQQRQAQDEIFLAEQERSQAKNQYEGTQKLLEAGVATRQQLTSDDLALKRANIRVEQATEALRLLNEYENKKQLKKLQLDCEETQRELERTKRRMDSFIAQKEAALASAHDRLKIQNDQYNKTLEQVKNMIIKAPQAGMIVYQQPDNRRSDMQPLAVGVKIFYRQRLMTLPDLSAMEVDVQVHETEVERVKVGQRANISVDAFPERRYTGEVKKVAVMADSAMWGMPDVKVYLTVVSIDQATDGLKPGMTAKAEILCKVIKDKLLVPVTGLRVLRGRTAAIVQTSSGLEIREVKAGETNDKFVIVESGLQEGDVVLLYEPKVMPEIPWSEPKKEETAVLSPSLVPPVSLPEESSSQPAASPDERPARGNRSGRRRGGESPARPNGGTTPAPGDSSTPARPPEGPAPAKPAETPPAPASADSAAPSTTNSSAPASAGEK